jgi:dihydroorotase
MHILIKQARLISQKNPLHNKLVDILVEGGKITEIKKNISAKGNVKLIEGEGLCVSTGWIDMQAVSCDPGFEHKENLDSLINCAAAGGFTGVCVHNYNSPVTNGKAQIEYIVNKTRNKVVDVFPLGTVTADGKGKDLSEMFDMKLSGAVAFSDHKYATGDAGTFMRALQYASNIGTLIISHCNDFSISRGGIVNEGETAVGLGLKGIPALAEELMVERNLSILEYTGGKLHIPTISTKGSIDLIKKARAAGLNVTAGVASINLLYDDSVLKDFDTNYKLDPTLRSKKDVQALRNAVENGTISVIVSDHFPQDTESKELEFDLAENGIINLQTSFCAALEAMGQENIEVIVKCLSEFPAEILGLSSPSITEGEEANLTLFTLSGETVFSEKNNQSRSKNSPFFNKTLKGRVIGIVNGAKSYFN